jgi:hypothetical protein
VIADGTQYADLPLSRWLGNDGDEAWLGAFDASAGWRGRLLTFELMLVSTRAVLTKISAARSGSRANRSREVFAASAGTTRTRRRRCSRVRGAPTPASPTG